MKKNEFQHEIDAFISAAIKEDVGEGDHTSLACVPGDVDSEAYLLIKESGILAGVDLALEIFQHVDPELEVNVFLNDGTSIKKNNIAFEVRGNARSILKAERLALNCMQRMSGIASKTRRFVELVNAYDCQILDTRKTTPGFRVMEKWAVRIGGGVNHRFGLYDMIMIKDNHIDYSGGIENAINKTVDYLKDVKKDLKIEIEARNLEEMREILRVGKVHRIMLDNFSYDDLRTAVKEIGDKYETEASGGITEESVVQYADCGVNFISVGALTHQIKSLDISLKAKV